MVTFMREIGFVEYIGGAVVVRLPGIVFLVYTSRLYFLNRYLLSKINCVSSREDVSDITGQCIDYDGRCEHHRNF